MKNKKVILNITAGIGDGIVQIPLIKYLKTKNYRVDGYFAQKATYTLFKDLKIFDNIIFKREKNFFDWRLSGYDHYYSDFILDKAFVVAALISFKNFSALYRKQYQPKLFLRINPLFKFTRLNKTDHISLQLAKLLDDDVYLGYPKVEDYSSRFIPDYLFNKAYYVIQVCAGDDEFGYKNWQSNNWSILINKLCSKFPNHKFVIIGAPNERKMGETIVSKINNKENLFNLIGQTEVNEVTHIIKKSKGYIGLDTGFMHLAAALNVPTFTLWGPSCKNSYGYELKDKSKNFCFSLDLQCSPCNSPINPNLSRVNHFSSCPDYRCIKEIEVDQVFNTLKKFILGSS